MEGLHSFLASLPAPCFCFLSLSQPLLIARHPSQPSPSSLPSQDLPLKKLRNFGGKLGEQLEALGCATAGEVQALPTATLAARFGHERAAAIEQAVRWCSPHHMGL
jgi:nucleotidyltransferase/DNA polymerase involved in DNA repair